MKSSRIFFVILVAIFAIVALTVFIRLVTNRDSTELIPSSSNVEYIRWQLPEGAKVRLGKGSINDIKFSPDGTRFAVATTIGVWMYDAQTGKEISLFKGDRQDIKGVAFSKDGRFLVSANSAGGIPRWNATTGELHSIFVNEKIKLSTPVIFSEDGVKLISVSRRHKKIHVWNLDDEAAPLPITNIDFDFKEAHRFVIALSQDRRFLAIAVLEPRHISPIHIQVWNATTGNHLFTLTGHTRWIKALAFSPDGKTLASGDEYRTIKLWNMDTATSHATFKAPDGFYALSFAPNGKLLASGGHGGSIRLWNATAKQQGLRGKIGQYLPTLTLKGHKADVSTLAFSPDGKMLLSGSDDGTIRAWDTITGRQQFICPGHTSEISELAALKKEGAMITVHTWDNQFLHWNINIGHHLSGSYLTSKNQNPVAISPDAETVVIKNWTAKNTYKLWDTSKKRIWATLKGHEVPLSKTPNFVFSLDGKRLASANVHQGIGLIHVWNIPTQSRSFLKRLFFSSKSISPQYTLEGHTDGGYTLKFSPNGKILATVHNKNKVIRLWGVETGSTRFTLTGHKQTIKALAFSPNGKILASGGNYQTIYLWDVTTGQQLTNSQTEAAVNTLQFSPDGKTIVSGNYNGKIQLWDAHTLRLLSTHIGHTDWVNALMFSEDGKTLFSASRDGTILLWDWEKIVQVNN